MFVAALHFALHFIKKKKISLGQRESQVRGAFEESKCGGMLQYNLIIEPKQNQKKSSITPNYYSYFVLTGTVCDYKVVLWIVNNWTV